MCGRPDLLFLQLLLYNLKQPIHNHILTNKYLTSSLVPYVIKLPVSQAVAQNDSVLVPQDQQNGQVTD